MCICVYIYIHFIFALNMSFGSYALLIYDCSIIFLWNYGALWGMTELINSEKYVETVIPTVDPLFMNLNKTVYFALLPKSDSCYCCL